MKKLIYCLMALVAASVMTSCDKCNEPICTKPNHNHTKSPIEMYVTCPEWGLENQYIGTPYLKTHYPIIHDTYTGEFGLNYNYEGMLGQTKFSLYRETLILETPNGAEELDVLFYLCLPGDIPFELNKKYYFGNVEGVNTDDGVVVSNCANSNGYVRENQIRLDRKVEYFESTYGWMMFTRFDEVKQDVNHKDYMMNMEFEFVTLDEESGEELIRVERGKIEDNPGGVIDNDSPKFNNVYVGSTYYDAAYYSYTVRDADESAYLCLPVAECDDNITPKDIFARGVVTPLEPYFADNEWNNRVVTIYDCIEGLDANTSYKLFIAAHDKANNKYEYCTKEFATQKQGKENNNEIFLGEIEVESLASNTISLSVPVRNADTLTYHICEGDSCNCISSDIEAGMTDIEFNNYRSFIALGYASFEIEGLKPNTTYHITVNGYNRISTAHKEITFTTAQ